VPNTNDVPDVVTVIQESALAEAEAIHVKSDAPADKFPEPTLVPSNEAIVSSVPRPMSVDEMKPEEDLSLESDKKSAGNAVVESIPATINGAPVIPVIEPVGVVELPVTEDYPAATLIVAESPASSDLTPSLPSIVVEESTADSGPVLAAVIPPTETNLVTEEKAQTPSSVPEVKAATSPSSHEHTTKTPKTDDFAEPSAIAPESHAVNAAVATERKVAEPIPAPQTTENSILTAPATPRKATPTTSSFKGIQEFPASQTDSLSQSADSSPSSSKFNSMRSKRTSIFGKIKNIFHHDKEKERK